METQLTPSEQLEKEKQAMLAKLKAQQAVQVASAVFTSLTNVLKTSGAKPSEKKP